MRNTSRPACCDTLNRLHPNTEKGVASVEFAMIAVVMLMIFLGLSIYWRTYQVQQSLTRAAGDGARHIHSLMATGKHYPCSVKDAVENQIFIQNQVLQVMQQSLQQSGLPDDDGQTPLTMSALNWSCANGQVSFEISYTLAPMFGISHWLSEPTQLKERSVVNFSALGVQ